MNQQGVDYFYENFEAQRWRGFRLMAVDGSTTQVPKTDRNWKYFGGLKPASGGECPMARLSQMFDVLNNVTVDQMIAPYFVSEEIMAKQHFKHLKANDLVLLDRKYPSFWLFQDVLQQGADVCARMPIDKWTVLVGNFLATGLQEQIVEFKPGWDAKKKCRQYDLPTTPIKLRLIRVELDTGETEVLATSLLDMQLYPYEVFKELYHQRWPVEEQYKLLKSRIEIANFTGYSVEAIKQDFYARVFMSNLTAMLAFPVHKKIAQTYQHCKLQYKINWTQALAKMKHAGVLLFHRKLPQRIIASLHELFVENVSAVRPGRAFPRKMKSFRKKYAMAYKHSP